MIAVEIPALVLQRESEKFTPGMGQYAQGVLDTIAWISTGAPAPSEIISPEDHGGENVH